MLGQSISADISRVMGHFSELFPFIILITITRKIRLGGRFSMALLVLYLLVVFINARGHLIAVQSFNNAMLRVNRNRLCLK